MTRIQELEFIMQGLIEEAYRTHSSNNKVTFAYVSTLKQIIKAYDELIDINLKEELK